MTTKYAILNPQTGLYTYCETIDERNNLIIKSALDFYKQHCHDTFYSNVEVLEDGSEKWTSPDGIEIPKMYKIAFDSEYAINEITKVVTLP